MSVIAETERGKENQARTWIIGVQSQNFAHSLVFAQDLAQLGQLDRCTVHQSKSHSAWVQRVPPIDPPPLSSQSKLENTDCKSAVVEVYISFSAHPRQILE
jgi:hypothetical protein